MINRIDDCVIFGLSNGIELAKKVAEKTGIKLGNVTRKIFADGEILVKSEETIREKKVFLFQSTSNPVNDSLMELLIAIDSFKRASAKSITVIIPYFGYSRQDRKASGREPITAKLVANFLEKAGADKVIAFDIHSEQTQGFFDIPVDTLSAICVLFSAFIKNRHNLNKLKVVAPDYGAVKKARKIAERLNVDLSIVDKKRPEPNVVEIANILGEVKGYNCILLDDMIDTGGTILENVKLLKQKGASKIFVMITHGIFSNNSIQKFFDALDQNIIDELYITDSIQANLEYRHKNLYLVSLDDFLVEVIDAQINQKSISQIYAKYWDFVKTS